jgi:predicted nucleotidyltransferase component of viral defense system
MVKDTLREWFSLTGQNRRNIIEETARRMDLPVAAAVEKDWWVVRTLEMIFQTDIAQQTVFKGGTSLSKAWKLIDRFSEDIDLALDKKFLGFNKEMTASQVTKLRKQSFKYLSEVFLPQLDKKFQEYGFDNLELQTIDVRSTDDDPVKIELKYPSVTEPSVYLPSRVLIEIGSRSLIEPFAVRQFKSFISEQFSEQSFADENINVPTVIPERTFLEKIFLLHEEFQQPLEKVRTERKSRHLYDLEKLMDTEFAARALANKDLYRHIVEHRSTMTPIRGIDYANHTPDKINPLPPSALLSDWEKDYAQMQQSMIYRESLPFDKLIDRISELKSRINKI